MPEHMVTASPVQALHIAIASNDPGRVRDALAHGANANLQIEVGDHQASVSYPMPFAAAASSPCMVGFYGGSGVLRQHASALADRLAIVQTLPGHGADPNGIMHGTKAVAAERGTCRIASFPTIEIAALWLCQGAAANRPNVWREEQNNETPPMKAAAGNPALVALLKRHGAGES